MGFEKGVYSWQGKPVYGAQDRNLHVVCAGNAAAAAADLIVENHIK